VITQAYDRSLAWPLSSVWAWLPWLLLLTDRVVRAPGALPVVGLAAVVGVQYTGGHPESSFHVLAATVGFALLRMRGWRGLARFAVAILAGRKSGGRRPAKIIRTGFLLTTLGLALIVPIVPHADSGWYLVIPLVIAGAGLGLLVSQLNNYSLAPIDDERISEAAGVNSASGSFGLSFGLAVAGGVLLATLSLAFTNMTNASPVIPSSQQQQIAQTLEDDAQVVSNTQLDKLLADEPPAVRDAVLSINTDATNLALQVALLVPILAGLLGLFDSFRMIRLPDIEPSAAVEAAALG